MPSPAPAATIDEVNALVETYYETLGTAGYASPLPLDPADTVLLLVDVQQHLTTRALRASLKAVGVYTADTEPVLEAIDQDLHAALQNIRLVLQACRENGIRPIHVGIQSLLPEAEDTGALHKAGGLLYPPDPPTPRSSPKRPPSTGKSCSRKHAPARTSAPTSTRSSETSAYGKSSSPGSTPTSASAPRCGISQTSATKSASSKTQWAP